MTATMSDSVNLSPVQPAKRVWDGFTLVMSLGLPLAVGIFLNVVIRPWVESSLATNQTTPGTGLEGETTGSLISLTPLSNPDPLMTWFAGTSELAVLIAAVALSAILLLVRWIFISRRGRRGAYS